MHVFLYGSKGASAQVALKFIFFQQHRKKSIKKNNLTSNVIYYCSNNFLNEFIAPFARLLQCSMNLIVEIVLIKS